MFGGLLAVTQAFAPLTFATKGAIVNISSIGALLRVPFKGKPALFPEIPRIDSLILAAEFL